MAYSGSEQLTAAFKHIFNVLHTSIVKTATGEFVESRHPIFAPNLLGEVPGISQDTNLDKRIKRIRTWTSASALANGTDNYDTRAKQLEALYSGSFVTTYVRESDGTTQTGERPSADQSASFQYVEKVIMPLVADTTTAHSSYAESVAFFLPLDWTNVKTGTGDTSKDSNFNFSFSATNPTYPFTVTPPGYVQRFSDRLINWLFKQKVGSDYTEKVYNSNTNLSAPGTMLIGDEGQVNDDDENIIYYGGKGFNPAGGTVQLGAGNQNNARVQLKDGGGNDLNLPLWIQGYRYIGPTAQVATSSYALTASYAENAGSSGGVGVGFPFSGSAVITGSLLIQSGGDFGNGDLQVYGDLKAIPRVYNPFLFKNDTPTPGAGENYISTSIETLFADFQSSGAVSNSNILVDDSIQIEGVKDGYTWNGYETQTATWHSVQMYPNKLFHNSASLNRRLVSQSVDSVVFPNAWNPPNDHKGFDEYLSVGDEIRIKSGNVYSYHKVMNAPSYSDIGFDGGVQENMFFVTKSDLFFGDETTIGTLPTDSWPYEGTYDDLSWFNNLTSGSPIPNSSIFLNPSQISASAYSVSASIHYYPSKSADSDNDTYWQIDLHTGSVVHTSQINEYGETAYAHKTASIVYEFTNRSESMGKIDLIGDYIISGTVKNHTPTCRVIASNTSPYNYDTKTSSFSDFVELDVFNPKFEAGSALATASSNVFEPTSSFRYYALQFYDLGPTNEPSASLILKEVNFYSASDINYDFYVSNSIDTSAATITHITNSNYTSIHKVTNVQQAGDSTIVNFTPVYTGGKFFTNRVKVDDMIVKFANSSNVTKSYIDRYGEYVGTASYANTASFIETSSYAVSASHADTVNKFPFPFEGIGQVTGTLIFSASDKGEENLGLQVIGNMSQSAGYFTSSDLYATSGTFNVLEVVSASFHTQSVTESIVNITTHFSHSLFSGSTIFGADDPDDGVTNPLNYTHQFTGSIYITGSGEFRIPSISFDYASGSSLEFDTVSGSTISFSSAYFNDLTKNIYQEYSSSVLTGSLIISGGETENPLLDVYGSALFRTASDATPYFEISQSGQGNLEVAGNISASSLTLVSGLTASLYGTSSWAQNVVGGSGGGSGIFALTGSVQATTNDLEISGSLTISQSKGITLGGEERTTWPAASVGEWYLGSGVQTSSLNVIVDGFISASGAISTSVGFHGTGSDIVGVISSSYALTSSYAENAGGTGTGFPFTGSAEISGTLLVTGSGIISASIISASAITSSLFGSSSYALTASYAENGGDGGSSLWYDGSGYWSASQDIRVLGDISASDDIYGDNIYPNTDGTFSLGRRTRRWGRLFMSSEIDHSSALLISSSLQQVIITDDDIYGETDSDAKFVVHQSARSAERYPIADFTVNGKVIFSIPKPPPLPNTPDGDGNYGNGPLHYEDAVTDIKGRKVPHSALTVKNAIQGSPMSGSKSWINFINVFSGSTGVVSHSAFMVGWDGKEVVTGYGTTEPSGTIHIVPTASAVNKDSLRVDSVAGSKLFSVNTSSMKLRYDSDATKVTEFRVDSNDNLNINEVFQVNHKDIRVKTGSKEVKLFVDPSTHELKIQSGSADLLSVSKEGGIITDRTTNIITNAVQSSIVAATQSRILNSNTSFIQGGVNHEITGSKQSAILGGFNNSINLANHANDSDNMIFGSINSKVSGTIGYSNLILGSGASSIHKNAGAVYYRNIIVGGSSHEIIDGLDNIIIGGQNNTLTGNSGGSDTNSGFIGSWDSTISNLTDSWIIGMRSKTADADKTVFVENLSVDSNITASGDISASGDVYVGDDLYVTDDIHVKDGTKIGDGGSWGAGNDDYILFDQSSRKIDTYIDNTSILSVGNGKLIVTGYISASGDVYVGDDIILKSNQSAIINNELNGQTALLNTGAGGYQGIYTSGSNIFIGGDSQKYKDNIPSKLTVAGNVSASGDLNLTNITSSGDVNISGVLTATRKSFLIPHPTKEDKKLQYASLEGPENGVYVRGVLKDDYIIKLPEYWTELVDEETITVSLTPVGKYQELYVRDFRNNEVMVGCKSSSRKIYCHYVIYGERKDIDKLKTEL